MYCGYLLIYTKILWCVRRESPDPTRPVAELAEQRTDAGAEEPGPVADIQPEPQQDRRHPRKRLRRHEHAGNTHPVRKPAHQHRAERVRRHGKVRRNAAVP